MNELTAATHTRPPLPPLPLRRGARLGDRLRLLRVAAGLTQTELAGDRFSKEYVSQIERGKTRPTAETVEWLAAAARASTPAFLVQRRLDRRARPGRGACSRAPRRCRRAISYKEAIDGLRGGTRRGRRDELGRARRPHALGRGLGADAGGRRPNGHRAAEQRARARRGFGLLRRRPRRDRLPARRLPLQAFEHLDRRRAPRRGARARGALGPARATGFAPTSTTGAPAATAASATSRPRARTSSTRSSSPQGVDDRRKMADAYFQASLVAERTGHWVLSRNYAEQAKKLFQELDDERTVGRLLNNLGGLSLLLGKPQRGDRAAEGVVRRRGRGRLAGATPARRWAGSPRCTSRSATGKRPRSTRARRCGCSRAARTSSTRSASPSSCSAARCSSATASTRRRSPSAPPTRRSSSSPRSATAPARGSPSAISPRAAGEDAEAARLYRNAAEALQDMRF